MARWSSVADIVRRSAPRPRQRDCPASIASDRCGCQPERTVTALHPHLDVARLTPLLARKPARHRDDIGSTTGTLANRHVASPTGWRAAALLITHTPVAAPPAAQPTHP